MTPVKFEAADALRDRIARAAAELTGDPHAFWLGVVGAIEAVPIGWRVSAFRGDPTSQMIARRIALEVAEHFGLERPPTDAGRLTAP